MELLELDGGDRLDISQLTDGRERLSLAELEGDTLAREWVAYYTYPGIEKARPSMPHRAFCAGQRALHRMGVKTVGISSQSTRALQQTIVANEITHTMLRDPELALARALGLPTIKRGRRCCYDFLWMIACRGVIAAVFYPVADRAAAAGQIETWLRLNRWGEGDA